ncbi:methionine--tRNA ligase [Candidatus Liberibacter americanus]|uniref:Methionine--tRNA ligase n=1 Tax=Candidatus Liberibacter americanus str. Sao Paulo TaxID=1261131 RepID=U6B5K3_9HYPH|nr:methionine--tRNA ligase [Candidatus Liberibacter americanus]AHA28063.1 Methionyl-tRNA synthetase [Candidatus Liberibacter americanus str. Sao Paulo]EMS35967.1 methionyl-tRNA synthetase [Candidatus Liberibacter americanus PW_SP]
MKNPEKLYLSTAISYSNAKPHIGHAYEMILADVFARFYRLDGRDVLFSTGSDEYGQKILKSANNAGIPVEDFVEQNTKSFSDMADALDISYDEFIRTTEKRHHDSCQELWKRILNSGDIYKGSYKGWYSLLDEAYCQNDEIYVGKDGQRYNSQNNPVQWMEEEGYFFRLSAYQKKLLAFYDTHPEFILPIEKRNEVISFVKSGLKDLSISRKNFDWGVKIPEDSEYIMYVWIDALTNYLTVTGILKDPRGEKAKFWPADMHIIGKDIVRFHAVYWPAFLLSANLPMPKRIFSHGFIINKGKKISKSLGNVIDPIEVIDNVGVDALRYFLLREISCGQDGFYDIDSVKRRANADLANGIGNLMSRSVAMILKNFDGKIPNPNVLLECDEVILSACSTSFNDIRDNINNQLIHRALSQTISIVSEVDRYFSEQKPWELKKTDPNRMSTVLYVAIDVVRQIAILLQPYVPRLADKILNILCIPNEKRIFSSLDDKLEPGLIIKEDINPVFPRFL